MIKLDNITVEFFSGEERNIVLQDVSLHIERNEFVSIVGHSGCGKTTLLNTIAGFLKPTYGTILVNGKNVTGPSSNRVVVFQEDAVFPWLTVKENIAYGLKASRKSKEEVRTKVNRYVELIGLESFIDYYPKNISGGMKKRVDLARAYAVDPEVLLMDEPFGSLDAYTRQNMQSLLLKLCYEERKTIVFVTHDISEAVFMSNRVILLSPTPGTIHKVYNIPFHEHRNYRIKATQEFISIQTKIEEQLHNFERP